MLAGRGQRSGTLGEHVTPATLLQLLQQVSRQHCEGALIAYVLDLLQASRQPGEAHAPLSPRAGLALLQAARAWSLLEGRSFVTPADVQAVFTAVAEHRLDGGQPDRDAGRHSQALLRSVDAIR
ncbi:MAG: AAA family ATPase [Cyanobium sp.]